MARPAQMSAPASSDSRASAAQVLHRHYAQIGHGSKLFGAPVVKTVRSPSPIEPLSPHRSRWGAVAAEHDHIRDRHHQGRNRYTSSNRL